MLAKDGSLASTLVAIIAVKCDILVAAIGSKAIGGITDNEQISSRIYSSQGYNPWRVEGNAVVRKGWKRRTKTPTRDQRYGMGVAFGSLFVSR